MALHLGQMQSLGIAHPATYDLILNPSTAVFTSAASPPEARFGAWSDPWQPVVLTRCNPDRVPLPASWGAVLTELVDTARRRHRL